MKIIDLYTDGSNIKDERAAWGFVLVDNDTEVLRKCSICESKFNSHRNISGEVFAALYGLSEAYKLGFTHVNVFHDYIGLKHWAEGSWRTNNELTKRFKKLVDKMNTKISITWTYVKAHDGNKWNDEADKTARSALGLGER